MFCPAMSSSRLHPVIPMMFTLVVMTAPAACSEEGNDDEPEPGFVDPDSTSAGLAFTVTDTSYSSSRLLYNDLQTGDVITVLSAESGDPALFWVGSELLFFNRTTDRRNFKRLDPRTSDPGLSAEMATPLAELGDPADVLPLGGDEVLVAHREAGVVFVMNVTTGAVVQTIEADWDFLSKSNAQLRPVALLAWDATTVYVLHQGKSNDSDQSLNGTQQVFVLNKGIDGKFFVVDQDDAAPDVQGIALPISNPERLIKSGESTLLVAGTCTLWDDACTSGFAAIDTGTKVVTMVFDTSALGLKGNGGLIPGRGNVFYGATVVDTGDPLQPGDKAITSFMPFNQLTATVMTFPASSAGCCALYLDPTSEALWVGDSTTAGTGSFSIYKGGSLVGSMQLDALPYEGLFVSP